MSRQNINTATVSFSKVLILLFVFLLVLPAVSQDKKKLEKSKRQLEHKIRYTRKLLNETKHKKRASLNEISLLNSQIRTRKQLIVLYNSEIKAADLQIGVLKEDISNLDNDIKRLKKEYGRLIYQSYKARSKTDQWMFVFASRDFYQAYKRIKHLKEINEYRREKVEKIVQKEEEKKKSIADLEALKQNRLELLIAKEAEADALLNDKNIKQQKVKTIIQKEKELKNQLAAQRREWQKLNNEIKRIIAAQMKRTDASNPKRIPLTPAEKKLSASFAGNKGKLPWPSVRGQITSRFGKHPHPNLHVTIDNKGVDIRCEKGAVARAVFDGKVASVIQLPKYKAVLIQHGNYYTVYSNLTDVFVVEGDMVKTKQQLGMIGTDKDSGETILHFELWSATSNTPLNPESWIL
jgi:septal ring factor EnvC (AmiA/AmiB activator)